MFEAILAVCTITGAAIWVAFLVLAAAYTFGAVSISAGKSTEGNDD